MTEEEASFCKTMSTTLVLCWYIWESLMVWCQGAIHQLLQLFGPALQIIKTRPNTNALQAPLMVRGSERYCLEIKRANQIADWLKLPSTLLSQPRCLAQSKNCYVELFNKKDLVKKVLIRLFVPKFVFKPMNFVRP